MEVTHERRKSSRLSTQKRFQVYTSICVPAYTVEVKDISPQGAFLQTKFLPKLNETISFNVIDDGFRMLYSGNAKVVRCLENGIEAGFGIEFDRTIPEEKLEVLLQ